MPQNKSETLYLGVTLKPERNCRLGHMIGRDDGTVTAKIWPTAFQNSKTDSRSGRTAGKIWSASCAAGKLGTVGQQANAFAQILEWVARRIDDMRARGDDH